MNDPDLHTLSLVPRPARLERMAGSFAFSPTTTVLLSAAAERGEWLAAESLQAALASRGVVTRLQPREQPLDTTGSIVLAVHGRDTAVFGDLPGPAQSGATSAAEGYRLSITADRITVVGGGPAGLVHGIRTLTQLVATADPLPCLTIDDAPALLWRGIMLDISRGKVPTLDTLLQLVDVLAGFKLNMLQLYMENTFDFRSHPLVGAGWGALTAEEITTLDRYCRDRYVELVPCIQSLGHQRRVLMLPEYRHLSHSADDWTLSPNEATWSFLGELYDDVLPCFTSRYVNVCCDEPYDLTHTSWVDHEAAVGFAPGGGAATPARSPGMQLYLTHLQRLHAMLAERGRTMMVWDDIVQQSPDLAADSPSDAIFLCWFYEATDRYPQPERIRQAGRRSVVCPGTSSWNSLFARLANARGNIRGFVQSGLEAGSLGVLTTDWGDNGHPNLPAASLYGYAYGAAEGWNPGSLPDAEFDRCFGSLLFGAAEGEATVRAMELLGEACTLPGINQMNSSATRAMFFRDPLGEEPARSAPEAAIDRMEALAQEALALLGPLQGEQPDGGRTLDELRLAARQIAHAARKSRVGRRIARFTSDDEEERRVLYGEVVALKHDLHALRWEYQRVWLARNHPEGLWLTLDQFDTAAGVLDRWRDRVAPAYTYG